MKRIFTLLLSVIMLAALLPIGIGANADAITKDPFYGIDWRYENETDHENITGQVTINVSVENDAVTLSYIGHKSAASMARKIKSVLDAAPEGRRYIHLRTPLTAFLHNKEDVIYLHNGAAELKTLFTEFLSKYKAIGGKLDGMIIDVEYINAGSWFIYSNAYYTKDANGKSVVTNPNIYQEIVENPRYATEIRPMLEERGFVFNTADPTAPAWTHYYNQTYTGKQGVKSELWGIWSSQGRMSDEEEELYKNCTLIWDTVIRNHVNKYSNDAVFAPLQQYFPEATLCDYEMKDGYGWNKWVDSNGGKEYLGGNSIKVGNVSNENTYSYEPHAVFYTSGYQNLPAHNSAVYADTPYNMFLYDANHFKRVYESADNKTISAWIAGYSRARDDEGSVSNTPYYTETLLHIGMLNPQPFLLYIHPPEYESEAVAKNAVKVISEIIAELTRVAGWSDRKPIEIPVNWNDGYVLSGMYAGGRNIWRITPDTSTGTTLESFKVKDKAPTFSINGKTITFPQGRIISDGTVSTVGTCGYWIETPADVMPVVTTDADRYAAYPSFSEDFGSYTNGAVFADVASNWKGSGTAFKVQGDALALSGTGTLKNTVIPEQITAGDGYAKQQVWEISFTLKSDMGGSESVNLLTCNGDAGIKLAGNKVYYNNTTQLGTATLSAGTKYTVRRELDFANKKCSYYLLSGSTVLAKAENVSISAEKATEIAISCQNLADQKVLVADYKLYPEGLTADFEVYDAANGIQLAGNSTSLKSVAYRLSWLNGTGTGKKLKVMAEFDGGSAQVVKELVLAPGCDGVETGIVENASGKPVKIYLSAVENTTIAATPNYDGGDFSWTAQGAVTPPGPGPTAVPTEPPVNTDPGETPLPTDSTETTLPTVNTDPSASNPDPTDTAGNPTDTAGNPTDTAGNPTDPAATEGEKTPDGSKGLSGGVIVLIVIGAVVLATAAGIGIWILAAKEKALSAIRKLFGK